jgi:quercetin dioxygenase-like cupin family protein
MGIGVTDTLRIGEMTLRFLVDETHGVESVVAFEFDVPPGVRVPAPHYHRDVDEVVYGLGGTLTVMLDGEQIPLGPGQSVFIPRGRIHQHQNLHGDTARALVVLTPGLIGRRYFEEVAALVNAPGKPDLAGIRAVMLRHGLVPA